ncbi:hypothetical protein [Spongiimicrobium salis]|uniref:hypothetical protein n=1 Tax=Spongiimicrobium salis TaxID=1667022 RepID=UPI00374D9734
MRKKIYPFLSFLLLFLGTSKVTAQELPNIVPLSPEVGSIAKFTEVPVSHYTGVPNISIPITSLKGRTLEVPVSLSYHAGGHKVEEIASWIGLGWNLNVGGQISRTVRQIGDDSRDGYLFSDVLVTDLPGMTYDELNIILSNAATLNRPDLAPDEFNFSFMGYSGRYYFNQNRSANNPYGELVQFPKSDLKIEPIFSGYTIIQWKITTPDGTEYLFGGVNAYDTVDSSRSYTSDTQSIPQPTTENPTNLDHITSWKLIRIKSIANDIITFHYESINYDTCSPFQETFLTTRGLQLSQSKTTGTNSKISEIRSANGTIRFNREFTKREDLNYDHALKSIVLSDNTGNLIDRIELVHSYFQSERPTQVYQLCDGTSTHTDSNGNYPYNEEISKRLKLEEVRFLGNQPSLTDNYSYKLEYNTTALPHRLSKSQDYWGYYNGEDNAYLIPSMPYRVGPGINYYEGANRQIKPQYTQANMLTKIIYPEGGFTTFGYENNAVDETFNYPGSSIISEPTIPGSFGLLSSRDASSNCNNNQVINGDFTIPDEVQGLISATSSSSIFENGDSDLPIDGQEIYFRIKKCNSLNGSSTCTYSDTEITYVPIGHDRSFELSPGKYRLEIVIDVPSGVCPENEDIRVDLSWNYRTFLDKKLIGGLRIKSITNYDNTGLQATKRSYAYRNETNKESGWIASVPVFKNDLVIESQGGGPILTEKLHSNHYIPFITTQNNNVGYTYVTETIEGDDTETDPDQKKTYEYSYLGFTTSYPGAPVYGEWLNGRATKQSFLEADVANSSPLAPAYRVKREQSNEYNYLFGAQSGSLFNVTSDMVLGFDIYFRPTELISNSVQGILGQMYSLVNGATVTNNTIEKELFYGQNNDTIAYLRETTYSYRDLYPHLFPILMNEKNSEGKETETRYYYPGDTEIASYPYVNELIDQHRISQPVRTEVTVTKNGAQLSKTDLRTIFRDWGDNILLPEKVQTQKGTDILETRIEYHDYDSLGNPLEVSKTGGAHIVYLWGYNKQYPIAKIENATFSEVAAALGVSETVLKNYDHTHINAINGLRQSFPKAMVTTYQYEPLIGVSSMTDPSGYTMSYEYDGFNRLRRTRDGQNLVEKEYFYHYKGEPVTHSELVSSGITSENLLFTGETGHYVISASGGSGNYSYTWTFEHNSAPTLTATGASVNQILGAPYKGKVQVSCTIRDLDTGIERVSVREVDLYTRIPGGAVLTNTDHINIGSTEYSFSVAPQEGSGNFSYSWSITPFEGTPPPPIVGGPTYSRSFDTSFEGKIVGIHCDITDLVTGQGIRYEKFLIAYAPLSLGNILSNVDAVEGNGAFTFSVNATGGSQDYTYDWHFDGVTDISLNNAGPSVSPVLGAAHYGPMHISVTATDNLTGATDTSVHPIQIVQPLLGGMLSSIPASIQANTNVNLLQNFTTDPSGGSEPYSYLWKITRPNGQLLASFARTLPSVSLIITPNMQGEIRVFCTVTDNHGFTANSNTLAATVTTGTNGGPGISGFQSNQQTISGNTSTLSITPTMDSTVSGLSCAWYVDYGDGNGFVETAVDPTLSLSLPCGESAQVKCIVTDSGGGTSEHTQTITSTCN